MIIYTSICANYTHKARLLAESVKSNMPEAKFIVCLTERSIPDGVANKFFDEVILAKDIWPNNFDRFIYKHAIVEASTAVKGRFLQYIYEHYADEDIFIYLDPDCYVYSDFVELKQALNRKPIVVCPHLLQPGNIDMELSSTAHGVYNLGFLAVKRSEEAGKFIDWWAERLHLFCYDDIARGIFTDQKWVDLAPCFFDVEIFKHRGYDFSIWSLLDCGMKKEGGKYYIKGDELRFIHFSGQGAMAEKCMRDWLPAGEHPFKELYAEYSSRHEESDADHISQMPWSYAVYQDGSKIDDEIRSAYRDKYWDYVIENPFALNNVEVARKINYIPEDKPDTFTKEAVFKAMKLIDDFIRLWEQDKKIYFYGAGIYGEEFATFCERKGLSIESFIVGDGSGKDVLNGIPVLNMDNSEIDRENAIVVLTLRSSLHSVVSQNLMNCGYSNIYDGGSNQQYDLLHQFVRWELRQ